MRSQAPGFSASPCFRGVLLVLLFCSVASAQDKPLQDDPWEVGFWAGGGLSVPGGTKDTHMMNAGLRFGAVLTDPAGPGFLRGQFEWAADAIPLYYIWQPAPAKNAYGVALNPVNLKWNFTSLNRTIPYLELGGGVLFTNHAVPLNTSHVNFLTHATLGLHIFHTEVCAITPAIKYEHISNAGLTTPNPGVNSVQFTIGLSSFGVAVRDRKRK
jgi:lipid A 3-O-deacylase